MSGLPPVSFKNMWSSVFKVFFGTCFGAEIGFVLSLAVGRIIGKLADR
jgi:ABC-type nitrate/sulfonate/bicarbonate transport system permease component